MRLLVVLAALFMLVPTMAVTAQESGPLVVSDPSADVRSEAQGTAGPGPSEAYSGLDLTGLAIQETASDFTFILSVADLKADQEPAAPDGIVFHVLFGHNGRSFRLEVRQILPYVSQAWFARLDMRDTPDGEWTQTWTSATDARGDAGAETIATTVPRGALADKDGAAPFPGRALDGMQVHSAAFLSNVRILGGLLPDLRFPLKVLDDMPDAGQPPARYDIAVGLQQTGHALLVSAVPFRASNGEATTFLLNATARNLSDRDDTFEFAAVGAPGRLAVTVPVTLAMVPAGGSIVVPVLVTVPFAHLHGEVDGFVLEMRSTSDAAAVGRIGMGVRYLAVPQPAGHHDSLYVHARANSGSLGLIDDLRPDGYMNTLEEDEGDSGLAMPPQSLSINGDNVEHTWHIPLEPGLEMGLDFDLGRVGRLALPVVSPLLPQAKVTLDAELVVGRDPWFSDEGTILGSVGPLGPVDILPQGSHLFEGELKPTPEADRYPFTPGENLALVVRLTTTTPSLLGDEQPRIAPGAHLELPLLEYHDPVDDALKSLDGPGLSPLGAQERLLNPGKAIVFPFSLANPADGERSYRVEVSGSNREWAALPGDRINVPAHGTASGSLIVRAPAGATDGDRADLILQAYDTADPTARGLLRLLAEVDTDEQHPDDTVAADELSKNKESPGAGLGLALLALAGLAAALRRRQ